MDENDPKVFWDTIKNLGPKRRADKIPMEILNENDITTTTTEDVHGKWMGEFQKLFQSFHIKCTISTFLIAFHH